MLYRGLLVLLTRFLPKGIMGSVLIALILSVGSFGLQKMSLVSVAFFVPILFASLLTPECITPKQKQNRGWYGSSLGICDIVSKNPTIPDALRIAGELMYIFSVLLPLYIQVPVVITSITLILFEIIFTHPIPLLKREFKPKILL